MSLFLERALFVVAPQNSGKSTQLRAMFRDWRLGTRGKVPPSSQNRRLLDNYWLSNERGLHLRLTSPHERNETPREWLRKAREKMSVGRWSFACPLQPDAVHKMPDVVESVRRFIKAFHPERVRVVFLLPTRHGLRLDALLSASSLRKKQQQHLNLCSRLQRLPSVEVMSIDARNRDANGLILADFFDFT